MFSADSALAVLCSCSDSEVTKLRTALDALPSLRSTAAPAPATTFAQPCVLCGDVTCPARKEQAIFQAPLCIASGRMRMDTGPATLGAAHNAQRSNQNDNWWHCAGLPRHRSQHRSPSRTARQVSPSRGTAQHVSHGAVRTDGWATAPMLEAEIFHTPRGRPYYMNKGKRLCAIACANTPCPYGQHACNQTLQVQGDDDRRATHQCSWCKRDRDNARR